MKNIKIKIVVVISLAFVLFSCTDNLSELNIDPNSSEKLNSDFVFTNAMLSTYPDGIGAVNRFNLMDYLQQEATYNILTSQGDKYIAEGSVRHIWNFYYPNCVKQIHEIISNLQEDPDMVNKLAAARIWKVYIYHRLTDLYGDIPYFEAGNGREGDFQPKYDKQSDIYADMFKELEESIASFDSSKPTFGSADLLYDGNIDKWQKLAYSLMLRLGMRLTEVDNASAESWVKKAIAGGPILEDADIAYIQYFDGSLESNRNPFSAHWLELDYVNPQDPNNVQGSKIAKTFIDQLKGNSTTTKDPRLNVISVLWVKQPSGRYVKDTATALQKGMENGKYDAYPADFETYSEPNPNTVMSYSAPVFVMTPAEVYFLLAEAGIRGWYSSGDLGETYAKGVSAAMRQWSLYGSEGVISDSDIENFITHNPLFIDGTFDDQLEQISTQKWILFYVDQVENYANWRRTNYPNLIPVDYPGNLTGGQIPTRFIVPESEELYNKENFLEAKERQSGNNTLLSSVWWDVE